jgi:hypothetical protein
MLMYRPDFTGKSGSGLRIGTSFAGKPESALSYAVARVYPTSQGLLSAYDRKIPGRHEQRRRMMTDDKAGPGAGNKEKNKEENKEKSGHPQDGSMLQTVVDEQLFIETAKDDQFSEMPNDPRSQPHQAHGKSTPALGAAPASDIEPPENARETAGPEKAPEAPVEGLVLGNSGFPSRGN